MTNDPIHVAIIMDGNGRWARRRGLSRTAGHREGAKAVDAVVQAAADPSSGIGWLTLYAFSSDNWGRPAKEVSALMQLFGQYLRREIPRCVENGIRLEVVGRRDRLSGALVSKIEAAEEATRAGTNLALRLAVDYSARDVIVRAASRAIARDGAPDRDGFRRLMKEAEGSRAEVPDVDLLVRTGGEQRLSDFLLWECAYAELSFTSVLWPDFGPDELQEALADFRRRDRRFGRVLEEAV
jgi:undecaprenyl diphosphate synthase